MPEQLPYLVREFLTYMETIQNKSNLTINEYALDLRMFFRFLKIHRGLYGAENFNTELFNEIKIDDIDLDFIKTISISDLYEFLSYINSERNNKARSRARKIACLKSFFKYLTTKNIVLDENPAQYLDTPKSEKLLPRYLTLDESKLLLKVVDGTYKERDYAILMLFLNCGLRVSELVNININHIKNDILTVIGKGGKERTLYLNEISLKAVNDYIAVRPNDKLTGSDKNALFISKHKRRISVRMVQFMVEKYIKMAGLDPERYSVHKLRHTAATLMYKHGNVDIRALQEILGHANLSATEIYTHVDSEILREAIKKNPLNN